MLPRLTAVVSAIVFMSLVAGAAPPLWADDQKVVFGRDIRPLLSDRCFKCHGPDREGQETDLRLDLREEAMATAITPGKAQASELIARVTAKSDDERMPPPNSGRKPLTPAEIELISRWIDEGAEYTKHWAWTSPQRPVLPAVKHTDWPAGAIDRFTLARMKQHGFAPSAEADRRTLIRRLSFDLLGLPPTPEEVRAFVEDDSPDAYAKLVERLLRSKHFGERMAAYWLDLVRYADTGGYHSDNFRQVDAYRDYVIGAFNNNLPFDRFTIEQLAGDLLEDPTLEQKIASGYNRLLQTTEEGGAQAKEYMAIYQADRVRNVSTVWLATTMGCCQCHDHKFDPFTMQDFYSLGAFFADINERAVGRQPPNLRLPTPEESAEIADMQAQIASAKSAPIEPEALAAWSEPLRKQLTDAVEQWTVVRPTAVKSSGGAKLQIQKDDSVLAAGNNPNQDDYTVTIPVSQFPVTGLRLEALTHPSLTNGSLSRANGNFVLTSLEVTATTNREDSQPLAIAAAAADYEQPGWPVANVLDGNPKTGWAVDGHNKKANRVAVFTFQEPLSGSENITLTVALGHHSDHAKHNIGRFRLSITSQAKPTVSGAVDLPGELIQILRVDPPERNDSQAAKLAEFYRTLAPQHEPVRKQIADWEKRLKAVNDSVRTTLVSEATTPRDIRILPRGNWLDDSGEIVQPAIPAHLGSLDVADRRATRLDLARWLTSRDNPLTARVFVNRLWMLYFGRGLAPSLEDVGHQGEWPTHPELLDWLAVEFMESGWDVKHMIKQIVLSQTYRQTSATTPELRRRDPFNKWLARQSRFRLDAEMVRDNALAVSGLLVTEIGGPSVKPYQPAGYWKHLNFPAREWQHDKGADQHRRGLYTFWCRSFLHPSLQAFDATSREECTAQRPRSNTPLQALVLLNDPTYVEAARVLAQQVAKRDGDTSSRLSWAFSRVLQREPSDDERQILTELFETEQERYAADEAAAKSVIANGEAPAAEEISPADVAAWTAVTRVLLNLHETVARQ